MAARELWHRGWAYLGIDAVLGLAVVALAIAWWILSAPLVPQTWLGLLILFVLHQVILAVRIVLRLAHLDAAREIFTLAGSVPPAAPEGHLAEREDHRQDDQPERHPVDDEGGHRLALEPGEEGADHQVGGDGGDDEADEHR